jgi:hypothetical protein
VKTGGGGSLSGRLADFGCALLDIAEELDFDTVLFRELWENSRETTFRAFVRYYLSDHRLLWTEFAI